VNAAGNVATTTCGGSSQWTTSSTTIFYNGGNVGIDNSTPQYPLDVNGTINGSIQDKGGQVFNVKAYGATGNGTTDDASAINSAISAAEAAGGGVVYFPLGVYAISSTLSITNATGLTFQGAGIGSVNTPVSHPSELLWTGGNGGTLILGGGLSESEFTELILSAGSATGVTLYQGQGNPTYNVSTGVVFDRVAFLLPTSTSAGGIGAVLGNPSATPATDQVDRQTFTNCDFVYGNTGIGVQLRSANGLNETFYSDTFNGVTGATAYGIDFLSGGFVSYNSIFLGNHRDVWIEDPSGWGATNIAIYGGHSESSDYSISTANTTLPSNGAANLTIQDFFIYNPSSGVALDLESAGFVYNLFNIFAYSNSKITVPQGIGRMVNAIGVNFEGSGTAGNFQTPDGTLVAPTFGSLYGATVNSNANIFNADNGNLFSNVISLQMNSSSYRPASTGFLRLKSGDAINFKNNANNADVNGLSENASNTVLVGGTAGMSAASIIDSGLANQTCLGTDSSGLLKAGTCGGSGPANLLNFQGPASPVTGTGSNNPFYSYTLPGGSVATGQGIRVKVGWTHSTGSATISYGLYLKSAFIGGGSSAGTSGYILTADIWNTASTTGASIESFNPNNSTALVSAQSLTSLNWASDQSLVIQFNVTSTDAITPILFSVEFIH
jgi:hypothetical protein